MLAHAHARLFSQVLALPLAEGAAAGQGTLAAIRRLQEYRQRFEDHLPFDVIHLAGQEIAAGDVAGTVLHQLMITAAAHQPLPEYWHVVRQNDTANGETDSGAAVVANSGHVNVLTGECNIGAGGSAGMDTLMLTARLASLPGEAAGENRLLTFWALSMPCEIYVNGQSVAVFGAADGGFPRRSVQVALAPGLLLPDKDHWLMVKATRPAERCYPGLWRGAWLSEYAHEP
jgi:hypothetical protein